MPGEAFGESEYRKLVDAVSRRFQSHGGRTFLETNQRPEARDLIYDVFPISLRAYGAILPMRVDRWGAYLPSVGTAEQLSQAGACFAVVRVDL